MAPAAQIAPTLQWLQPAASGYGPVFASHQLVAQMLTGPVLQGGLTPQHLASMHAVVNPPTVLSTLAQLPSDTWSKIPDPRDGYQFRTFIHFVETAMMAV